MKESIMMDEIANQDIENTAKNAESSEEAMNVVKEMEKIIRSNKCSKLWLAYQQGQIFERFKLNDKFINMVNQFGISKTTMVFKILNLKFLSKYPRMKKSLLSLQLLKNNFKKFAKKLILKICQVNASELK